MDKLTIPQLRFKGFESEWVEAKICDVTDCIVPGRNKPKSFDGNIPWITTPDISHNLGIKGSKIGLSISEKIAGSIGSKIVPKNAIVISCVGDLGLVAFTENEVVINQQLHAFIPHINQDYRFLMYSLSVRKNYMDKVSTKTAVPYLNKTNCNSIPVFLATLQEQQKIASFLTAVDDKIYLLNKKKELLTKYKKGVMQKLFNQEIRFKDEYGNDYPDWEENSVGEVYSFKITNSYSRDNLNYLNGLVKNIHYGDVHTKFSTLFDIKKEYVPYLNSEINLSRISSENYCEEGDLVIADASEDYNGVGKAIELTNLNNEKVLAGLHTILARPNHDKITIGFGGYLMQSSEIRAQINKIAQGSKVLSISSNRLSRLIFSLPCKPEQYKIANFLSSIDDKIRLITQQIEKSQAYKKGLLQKMFV